MPLLLQVKLLRVLQDHCVERLGGNSCIPVDCRIVAASKVNLKHLSEQGSFRADLYYRLNVISIEVPPLRKRLEDIAPLMAYFISKASSRFNRKAVIWNEEDLLKWQQYDWPGNVRELKTVAERLCLGVSDGIESSGIVATSLASRVGGYEQGLIRDALKSTKGNVSAAAELLQMPKKTLYDKLNMHGLEPKNYR